MRRLLASSIVVVIAALSVGLASANVSDSAMVSYSINTAETFDEGTETISDDLVSPVTEPGTSTTSSTTTTSTTTMMTTTTTPTSTTTSSTTTTTTASTSTTTTAPTTTTTTTSPPP